jgi:hypothetical protein
VSVRAFVCVRARVCFQLIIPVIVLTGNCPAKVTPASAIEGARWMFIAASTQDKENGLYKVEQAKAGTEETREGNEEHGTLLPSVDFKTGSAKNLLPPVMRTECGI